MQVSNVAPTLLWHVQNSSDVMPQGLRLLIFPATSKADGEFQSIAAWLVPGMPVPSGLKGGRLL